MNTPGALPHHDEDQNIELSWVLPVYYTGQFLQELVQRIKTVSNSLNIRSEIVIVVDGCKDYLEHAATYMPNADVATIVLLPKNCGQDAAILEGLQRARGSWAIMMDADLQDTPEEAAKLIALRSEEIDVVFANRTGIYQQRSRMLTSWLYRGLFSALSGLPKGACLFALANRRMIDSLVATRTEKPWLLALMARHGHRYATAPVIREPRKSGKSSYSRSQRIQRGFGSIVQLIRIQYFGKDQVR